MTIKTIRRPGKPKAEPAQISATQGRVQSGHHSFFATCARGTAEVLADELREIGLEGVEVARGGVSFKGTLEAGYKACLWSRVASRILLPLKTFKAVDPESLYKGVRSIHWTDHLTASQTFAIDFTQTGSKFNHTHFAALKSKDAIVDQFRTLKGERPSIDVKAPDLKIQIHVEGENGMAAIDLSGDSLHRRGYRELGTPAPLKENLGAALLRLAGAHKIFEEGGALVDPMCGSGTFVIEGIQMALGLPPSGSRRAFGFEKWICHDEAAWERVKAESKEKTSKSLASITQGSRKIPLFVGCDESLSRISESSKNAERARVSKFVHFERRPLKAWLDSRSGLPAERGLFIVNPPYGERLGEEELLIPLYQEIGDVMKKRFTGWQAALLTGNRELSKKVGLQPKQRIPVWNGPIECRLFLYELYSGTKQG